MHTECHTHKSLGQSPAHPFASYLSSSGLLSLSSFPSSPRPGSSNRDTQFSRLHARVAETAVERNFRSRKKPRANIAIKFAPCKNPRSPCGLSLSPSLSLSLFLSLRPRAQPRVLRFLLAPFASFDREADLHARPAAVARSRGGEGEREGEQVRSFRDGKTRSGEITRRRWSRHEAGRGGKEDRGGRGKLRGADGKVTSLIGARCRPGNCVRASLCSRVRNTDILMALQGKRDTRHQKERDNIQDIGGS